MSAKRGPGRPPRPGGPMDGHRIRLDDADLALAAAIGAGKVSRGARRAIRMQRYPVCQQPSLLVVYWEHWMAPGLDFDLLQEHRR